MIDWVHVKLPYAWTVPIQNGKTTKSDGDGVVVWETHHACNAVGSYDSNIRISTRETGRLEISGNPAKFLQGHNLVGTDDLISLVVAAALRCLEVLEQPPPSARELELWNAGEFRLSRVHINRMYELPTIGDVRAWIRAASDQASIKFKRNQSMREGTLYIGKQHAGKRRTNWFFKIYCKHDEICKHELHSELPLREELYEWSKNLLRIELEINTEELKRNSPRSVDIENHEEYLAQGLSIDPSPSPWNDTFLYGIAWKDAKSVGQLFEKYFARLNLGENSMIPDERLEGLKPSLRVAYKAWLGGADLREDLSKATYHRYKKQFLELGIDISAKKSRNVVPLVKYVTAKPVETPKWLTENPVLYFQARRAA